jgi:hypothetical protein
MAAVALLGGLVAGPQAMAAELTADYLHGRWSTGSVDNCKNPEHEQTVFREDGTFATEHAGKALAVGFWTVNEDELEMHILSTEASLPKLLADAYPGDYHALTVNGLAFDITQDKFKLVQSIEGQVRGLDMVRCPAK